MTGRLLILAALTVLSACVSPRHSIPRGDPAPHDPSPHYKVGKPYKVNGKWYRPAVDDNYSKVGMASWYGKQFHGRKTANGEIFDMNQMTAAHPTLPMPSLVEVTNLENRRRITVRVNDRGPFAHNRIIDLSRAAARQLGFEQNGVTKVRVKYIGPAGLRDDPPAGRLRAARTDQPAAIVVASPAAPVAEPLDSAAIAEILREVDETPALTEGAEEVALAEAVSTSAPNMAETPNNVLYVVRVAALSSLANIDTLERQLAPIGPLRISRQNQPGGNFFYRINMGPYNDAISADTALGSVRNAGYPDAALVTIEPSEG